MGFFAVGDSPGLWFVHATLVPLASFVLLLLVGGLRWYARSVRTSPAGGALFQMLGGDTPRRGAAFVATGAIGLAFLCSVIGAFRYSSDFHRKEALEADLRELHDKSGHSKENEEKAEG